MSEVERQLAKDETAQLLVGRKTPGLLFFERRDRIAAPGLIAPPVHALAHRTLLFGSEPCERRGEDQPAHAAGMAGSVCLCDHTSVRVAEKQHPFKTQVIAQLLEVVDVVADLIVTPVRRTRRAGCATRVEHDQRVLLPERGQVAEVVGRESGPARVADEHRPMPELAVCQLAAVRRREAHVKRGSGRQRPSSSR